MEPKKSESKLRRNSSREMMLSGRKPQTKPFSSSFNKGRVHDQETETSLNTLTQLENLQSENKTLTEKLQRANENICIEVSKRKIIQNKFKETQEAHKDLVKNMGHALSTFQHELTKTKNTHTGYKQKAEHKISVLTNEVSKLKAQLRRYQELETLTQELVALSSMERSEAMDVQLNSLMAAIEAKSMNKSINQ